MKNILRIKRTIIHEKTQLPVTCTAAEGPCRTGAKALLERGKLSKIVDLEIGEIRIMHQSGRLHLAIHIKNKQKEILSVLNVNVTNGP